MSETLAAVLCILILMTPSILRAFVEVVRAAFGEPEVEVQSDRQYHWVEVGPGDSSCCGNPECCPGGVPDDAEPVEGDDKDDEGDE